MGRHGDLVVELAETIARQPFRQRPAELLMLALYRSGRAAEAVTVYDDLRRRLADELGIDPDPTVRELCERIRREDPDLAEPRPGTDAMSPTPATVVPAQLPRDISTFTGRGSQLAVLDRLLDEPNRVAVLSALTGGGGVGKTALAVHWGRKRRDRFPDGQVFVNLRGFDLGEPVTPQQALPRLLRALGVSAADVPSAMEDAAALFRSLAAAEQTLLLRVSLIPGADFHAELVAEVCGGTETGPKQALDRLESAHLIEQHRHGRYRMHDLIRAYASRRAQDQLDDSSRDEVRDRCIDWYCAVDTDAGEEELNNVVAAFETWRSAGSGWRLAIALGNYVHYGYPMHRILRLVEPELERVAALGDMDSLAQMYNAVAKISRESGDFDAAVELGRRAVSAIEGTTRGDFDGKYQGNLALFLLEAGKTREAEEFARSSLSAARESSNQAHVEICSAILAATYREMGEYRVAIDLLFDLLDDFGGSFDSPRGLMTRLQFAHVYLDMGRHQEAAKQLAAFDESYQQGGSTRADVGLLQLRGELALGARRYTDAHTYLTETLTIATQTRRLGSIRAMEIALAELFLGLGELKTALDHLARAGSTRHSSVAVRYRADCLRVETAIRIQKHEYDRAREAGERALALFAAMPRWHGYARTLVLLAEALDGMGHHSQADEHRDEALTIFTRLDVPEARSLRSRMDARPR